MVSLSSLQHGVLVCFTVWRLQERIVFPRMFGIGCQECEWSFSYFPLGVGRRDVLIGMSDTRMRTIQLTTVVKSFHALFVFVVFVAAWARGYAAKDAAA